MGYHKNEWILKFGYKKVGGNIFLPINGKRIQTGSKIDRILLDSKGVEKITIHGDFKVVINGESTGSDEIIEEFEDFLQSIIIDAPIQEAWMDNQGSLTICIDSDPKIRLFVDNEKFEWPIAKWTYDQKDGYLSN